MFLPSIEKISKSHKFAKLSVVQNSGHVVNVDQPTEFNNRAISFIRSL
jgi:pimeloyl-ACP methyl ester carboxylesterase